jgi:hypothetical protein
MCVFGSFGTYNSLLFKAAFEVGIEGTMAPRICDLFFRDRLAESTHADLIYGDLLEIKIVQAVFELHERPMLSI